MVTDPMEAFTASTDQERFMLFGDLVGKTLRRHGFREAFQERITLEASSQKTEFATSCLDGVESFYYKIYKPIMLEILGWSLVLRIL
jgi:hypothetical protein